jgi:iron-sulfur cluster assembly protein
MIQISENADRQIVKLVGKEGLPPTGGLRVGVKAGGCSGLSYVFAWEPDAKADDEVITAPQGARIFVDRKSFRFLDGTTLDYDTSLMSKGFVFENPQAKSTCGCGTSFSM